MLKGEKILRTILTIKQTRQYSRRYIKVNNAINTGIFSLLNYKANNMALSWTGKENSSFILLLLLLESQTQEIALLVACSNYSSSPPFLQEQELLTASALKQILEQEPPLNSKQYLLFAIRGPLNPGNQTFMRFSFP